MRKFDFKKLEDFSITLARHAGKILLDYRGKAAIVVEKGKALDFATEADIASERYIRSEIGRMFPTHGVMGEEEGLSNKELSYSTGKLLIRVPVSHFPLLHSLSRPKKSLPLMVYKHILQ